MKLEPSLNVFVQSLDLETLAIDQLFALRLFLDEPEIGQDIAQDIADLSDHPQRLLTSYRDEWLTFCRRALQKVARETVADEHELVRSLQVCVASPDWRRETLVERVRAVDMLLRDDKIALLKSPAARRIDRVIAAPAAHKQPSHDGE